MGPLDQFSAFAVARMRGRLERLAYRDHRVDPDDRVPKRRREDDGCDVRLWTIVQWLERHSRVQHPKGTSPEGNVAHTSYVPPKIIGIMSGHFWEAPDDPPEMFRHSGLSYLTKSTAILALIGEARAHGFKHPEDRLRTATRS